MPNIQPGRDGRMSRREEAIEGEIVGCPTMPRAVEKAITYAVAKQYGKGVVGVVRVQTTHRVSEEAMYCLDRLEADETAAIARDPHNGGRRQRRLVDAYLATAEDAIRTTGRAFGR
jgi:hypothetical protein